MNIPYDMSLYAQAPYDVAPEIEDNEEKKEEKGELDDNYRIPPFGPGPFFGPRPFFPGPGFGPRPFFPGPFFGPRPFFPGPFFGPRPFFPPPFFGPRPFFPGPGFGFGGFGLPFLSGLALGGLLF